MEIGKRGASFGSVRTKRGAGFGSEGGSASLQPLTVSYIQNRFFIFDFFSALGQGRMWRACTCTRVASVHAISYAYLHVFYWLARRRDLAARPNKTNRSSLHLKESEQRGDFCTLSFCRPFTLSATPVALRQCSPPHTVCPPNLTERMSTNKWTMA